MVRLRMVLIVVLHWSIRLLIMMAPVSLGRWLRGSGRIDRSRWRGRVRLGRSGRIWLKWRRVVMGRRARRRQRTRVAVRAR